MQTFKQREIKFRAWDKDEKKMYHWNPHFFLDMSHVTGFSSEFPTDDNMILMQYTGVKDKEGKEIYEGDIVQWYYWFDEDFPEKHRLCTVEFNHKTAGFYPFAEESDGHYDVYSENQCVVIGNVFENPQEDR